jgi:hypothetical protein
VSFKGQHNKILTPYQGVIPTKGDGQFFVPHMLPNYICNRLIHARHESRVFEDANGWVIRDFDVLELSMTIEVDFPAKPGKLIDKPRFDKMDGAFVDTKFWLGILSGVPKYVPRPK